MNSEVVIGGSLEQHNSGSGDADLTLKISGDARLDISGETPTPTLSHEIDGDVGLTAQVDGQGVEFFMATTDPYEGAYEVTPTTEAQILPTALKNLTDNIVINPIPSNYGLITWDGSTLTVS